MNSIVTFGFQYPQHRRGIFYLLAVFGEGYPRRLNICGDMRTLTGVQQQLLLKTATAYGLWRMKQDAGFSHAQIFSTLGLLYPTKDMLRKLFRQPIEKDVHPALAWKYKFIFYYLTLVYPDIEHLSRVDRDMLSLLATHEKPIIARTFRELLQFKHLPLCGPVLGTSREFDYCCKALGLRTIGTHLTPREIARGYLVFGHHTTL